MPPGGLFALLTDAVNAILVRADRACEALERIADALERTGGKE